MEDLYQEYKDRAEFLFVVIREVGHFVPGLEFLLQDPVKERRRSVAEAMDLMGLTMPAVLDADDGQVETAYAARPFRLVVVGSSGRIAFDANFQAAAGGLNVDRIRHWFEENLGSPSNAQ